MSSELLKNLAREAMMLPQEELLEIPAHQKSLFIGIPKEISFQENRVALVPESVALLVNNGHRVLVESGAGANANFSDTDYSEAGAEIAYDTDKVFKADIILKVAPPTVDEIDMMGMKQTLFSAIQLSVHPKNTLEKLMQKKATAIAWDFIKDEGGVFPIVRSMGEIAGVSAVNIASELLSINHGGRGVLMGGVAGIAPTEVVILGAGTVAEYATKAATGLGASVKVFDDSLYKLRRLQNELSFPVWTSTIQPKVLAKALKRADVLITAVRSSYGKTPCIVTEEMVESMKDGSVIVDVSIDQGGCVETSQVTTHSNPTYKLHGVLHYCVPNIASRVPRTASFAVSNIFAPLALSIGEKGGVSSVIRNNQGLRNGVYMYQGKLTNRVLGEAFNLPYKDIELLISAIR